MAEPYNQALGVEASVIISPWSLCFRLTDLEKSPQDDQGHIVSLPSSFWKGGLHWNYISMTAPLLILQVSLKICMLQLTAMPWLIPCTVLIIGLEKWHQMRYGKNTSHFKTCFVFTVNWAFLFDNFSCIFEFKKFTYLLFSHQLFNWNSIWIIFMCF